MPAEDETRCAISRACRVEYPLLAHDENMDSAWLRSFWPRSRGRCLRSSRSRRIGTDRSACGIRDCCAVSTDPCSRAAVCRDRINTLAGPQVGYCRVDVRFRDLRVLGVTVRVILDGVALAWSDYSDRGGVFSGRLGGSCAGRKSHFFPPGYARCHRRGGVTPVCPWYLPFLSA